MLFLAKVGEFLLEMPQVSQQRNNKKTAWLICSTVNQRNKKRELLFFPTVALTFRALPSSAPLFPLSGFISPGSASYSVLHFPSCLLIRLLCFSSSHHLRTCPHTRRRSVFASLVFFYSKTPKGNPQSPPV